MANRAKEDEKNEKAIRNLLKLPDNRRCINCNSLGPQYVCTNFWIFICTTCSGIHREFTHRVKSVSIAKFTSQEVSALQGGGNASAKEIYFKEWDPQRHSFPDSSNVERLRDFIKHVYVDRRYTGERSFDKPPRVKMGEAEDSYENRRDTYRAGSRSPPYEDTYERRYSERPSPGGRSDDRNYKNTYDERRSPGYDQESRQYGDYRRSPARAEIVNDWRREDRFGSGKRSDDGRISDASSQLEGKSPNRQKDLDVSSPPIVRPVRDILGDNVTPLRIIEPPKANGGRVTDGSLRTQDLFAPTYPSSAPYPGWQTGPPQGYGFNMQFNPAVSMQMFPHSSQSTNPFDVNSEVSSVHAPTFPSMAPLQGALPNMSAPAGLLRTSSLGTPTPTWMPFQSNYPLAMPPQAPSFASAMPPGAYMGQQLPNNLPPRQQAVAGAFGPPNLNQQHQQLGGIYSAPATPNLYSAAGGNPFG
ncbi:ADP-ribosylation factor GTPase-activating protein AGD14 [Actinidia chinensis var. chinensis]|uniref:ADP-ribosylation factor GTPase-activating protein AGD14 n=1 Tax=Actinidia chinensis var. chinensis TaxID=1590841 RepID=A0A2R6QV32_ACTCC|nr:ADP-ribosylation factor GTPase-activating protein AGD14 [Actinidia chinensis var. chinensis]